MDINYLQYSLKSFLESDFRKNEIEQILNDLEPEVMARKYAKSLNFNKNHEALLRLRFKKMIEKAHADGVPLGVELGNCQTLEDAYLVRQRYISSIMRLNDVVMTFNKYLLVLLITLLGILIVILN